MEIKFASKELDKRSLYIHTRGTAVSLKDVEDGTLIQPAEIVVYEDTNAKGETQMITSIIDANGEHYATNSKYFREELSVIFHLMDGDPYTISVRKKVSKGGRTFVTCELV
jgi:hypothetical protein